MRKQRLAKVIQMDKTTMVVMKRWVWRAYITYSVCADCTLLGGIIWLLVS